MKNTLIALSGIVLTLALALGAVYGSFWILAPHVAAAIPAGAWHGFETALVYIVIDWVGGVTLPFLIIWIGITVTASALVLAGFQQFSDDMNRRSSARNRFRRLGLDIQ